MDREVPRREKTTPRYVSDKAEKSGRANTSEKRNLPGGSRRETAKEKQKEGPREPTTQQPARNKIVRKKGNGVKKKGRKQTGTSGKSEFQQGENIQLGKSPLPHRLEECRNVEKKGKARRIRRDEDILVKIKGGRPTLEIRKVKLGEMGATGRQKINPVGRS